MTEAHTDFPGESSMSPSRRIPFGNSAMSPRGTPFRFLDGDRQQLLMSEMAFLPKFAMRKCVCAKISEYFQ
jgi:hypothetical protein